MVPGPCGKQRPKLSALTRAEEKYVADILTEAWGAVTTLRLRDDSPAAFQGMGTGRGGGGGGGAGTINGQALIHDQPS